MLELEEKKNELIDALLCGPVQIRFTKLDGEERLMACTLSSDYLPEGTFEGGKKKNPDGLVSVWDIEKSSWRSFWIDRVLSVKLL